MENNKQVNEVGNNKKSNNESYPLKQWIARGAVTGATKWLVGKLLEACPSIDKLLDNLASIGDDIDFEF